MAIALDSMKLESKMRRRTIFTPQILPAVHHKDRVEDSEKKNKVSD